MNKGNLSAIGIAACLLTGLFFLSKPSAEPNPANSTPSVKPALNVNVVQASRHDIPLAVTANGSIAAWQEAIIGAEIGDLHLSEVRVQIGDTVRKGQVLAVFADEMIQADVANQRALLAEAEANLAEARINAQQSRELSAYGALSKSQINQYQTNAKTALAKVQAAKAQLDTQLLRLKYTKVVAKDDGIISARNATLGAVVGKGQELFRLIRQNRLEWRAEVTGSEIAKLKPGLPALITVSGVGTVTGTIRALAPTLDSQNRNGLVYVDLPQASQQGIRAGMFAKGEFQFGNSTGLTVPQTAVSLREGFSYVFVLADQQGDRAKVRQTKIELGRQSGDNFEVLSGINPDDRLVASGATFLSDGDTVRIVTP